MRVYNNSIGHWCRFVFEDKEEVGIVASGGQDKRPNDWRYRFAMIFDPKTGQTEWIDWPDIVALGPAVKAPRF